MGNRAVITTEARKLGVYLHWNGGLDSVECFLRYCEMQEFASPDRDREYGFAHLTQVIANFFSPSVYHVGVQRYTTDMEMDQGDNGIYVIKDWKVVRRVNDGEDMPEPWEREGYDYEELLRDIDRHQPEYMQMGDALFAREMPANLLSVGDSVWRRSDDKGWHKLKVVGIGERGRIVNGTDVSGVPIVDYIRGGDPDNINNYLYPNHKGEQRIVRVVR